MLTNSDAQATPLNLLGQNIWRWNPAICTFFANLIICMLHIQDLELFDWTLRLKSGTNKTIEFIL